MRALDPLVDEVALPVLVDRRRIRGECLLDVGDEGERFVVDLDRVDRGLAISGVSAATAATISPSQRTTSRANSVRSFTNRP